jgi:hypothetical protein
LVGRFTGYGQRIGSRAEILKSNDCLDASEEILASDPAYRFEKDKAHRSESLRQRLIALRETEIKPEFPESPLETGILRKSLLEEFLQKRPKNRDEWFRKIPHQLRVSVDSKQVGKYLDRVLGIIAEGEG